MADATATATANETPASPSPSSFLVRVGLVFSGWAAFHLTILALLAQRIAPWWIFLAVFLAIVAFTILILRSFGPTAHPGAMHRLFVVRPFWYVQLALPFLSIAAAIAALVGLPFGRSLAWAGTTVAVGAALMAVAYLAGYVGSKALVRRDLDLAYPDLPPAFDGLRIAQLSDLHVGPQSSDRYLRRVVRMVEGAKPDVIVHTGDQVDDYHEDTARFVKALGGLQAPLGVFAIPGNHDIYAGWREVRAGLDAAGIRVLVNDAQPIRRADAEVWIAGTGDPAARSSWGNTAPEAAPDLARTFEKVPREAFTIVLAHNPALWPHMREREPHLTLSGHTHHGQLSIPWLNWSLANPFLKYAMGLYEEGRGKLYINPGTNYWGLPFRLGAWPEVTILTLRRSAP